jgi:hypothetical protein
MARARGAALEQPLSRTSVELQHARGQRDARVVAQVDGGDRLIAVRGDLRACARGGRHARSSRAAAMAPSRPRHAEALCRARHLHGDRIIADLEAAHRRAQLNAAAALCDVARGRVGKQAGQISDGDDQVAGRALGGQRVAQHVEKYLSRRGAGRGVKRGQAKRRPQFRHHRRGLVLHQACD